MLIATTLSFARSAIRHAEAADVSIVVTINKIDIPGAAPKHI